MSDEEEGTSMRACSCEGETDAENQKHIWRSAFHTFTRAALAADGSASVTKA